ncbi:MAG: autotransporter assembly complex family protein [Granulosicoccaceae bacterium]
MLRVNLGDKKAPIWHAIVGVLLLLSCPLNAAELTINGVNAEIAENIRLTVGKIADFPEDLSVRISQSVSDQAKGALGAVGYFSSKIDTRYSLDDAGQRITLDIELNDPVRVRIVLPLISGPAREDPDYMPVLGKLPLRRNAVFNSDDYEAAKNILIDAAQDRGYFDFKFNESSVKISRAELSADITLDANSGPRYQFGAITFDQEIFSEAFLNRWLVFREGDPFESSQLATFTRNLQSSGYFASVRVIPQRDDKYGNTVPVKVALTPTDNNHVGIGIGFATDTDFRTKFTWEKPRINRFGHSAETDLRYSKDKQSISFSYRIPRQNMPLDNYWSIDFGLQNEVNEANEGTQTESLLNSWQFQRVRKFRSDWQESVFLRWERERSTIRKRSTIADVEETDLLLPGIRYSRVRSEGRPFTTKGHSTNIQLLYGSRDFYSTIDFLKITFSLKYIKEIVEKNTLILSLQYGATQSNDYDRVPVSQRFFAGGDSSVRGYAFKDISPDDGTIGGRYLEVVSLEYNYRLNDAWSVAAFVDTGRAFKNFDNRYSTGAGVGMRWQSPVGPFRLDIAMPVDDADFESPRLHLSLGPDL